MKNFFKSVLALAAIVASSQFASAQTIVDVAVGS